MRITRQLLKGHSSSPLEEVEYIDLSGNDIVSIEHLDLCKRLKTLVLSDNRIDAVHNIYCCRNMWSINLSGNKVKSICGITRYPILGVLNLSFNDLDWNELRHLSHMTILNLTLVGNSKLDSDPNYREHVIDILPNVWMLDGILISAEERKKVNKFFLATETTVQPVRHKAMESVFVPTSMKNLLVTGVFGEKTTHLMARFPVNYTHNAEMDKQRLAYLAYTLQAEMQLLLKNTSQQDTNASPVVIPELQSLVEQRYNETEQCNMLLLLLLAFLEYELPVDVMKATLVTAKLTVIGNVNCEKIFHLPAHMLLETASLLLSAAAVDRQEKKDGGLYSQLYTSLCSTMESVQRKALSKHTQRGTSATQKSSPLKEARQSQWCCLLASEVIHLMCLVPLFFESMETNKGLMLMVAAATKTPSVADVIGNIACKVQGRKGDVWEIYQEIASYLLKATSANVMSKRRIRKPYQMNHNSINRTISQLLLSTQPKSSGRGRALRALSAGAVSKRLIKRPASKSIAYTERLKEPEQGDFVLVNSNQVARIVALPETRVAVLQINSKPDSYFYTDTSGLVWDSQLGCWTKDNLAADLSTSHLSVSPLPSSVTLPSSFSLDESVSTFKMETPDLSQFHNSQTHTRPPSRLSYRSDDLQTIHSQDELDFSDDDGVHVHDSPTPPFIQQSSVMRVDIASSNVSDPGDPQLEHQKHVLQQYSAHNLHQESNQETNSYGNKTKPNSSTSVSSNRPVTSLDHSTDLRNGNTSSVLVPKVNLTDTWEASKSLPVNTHSIFSRPHSCRQTEAVKQLSKQEPHMSTFAPISSSLSPTPYTTPLPLSVGGVNSSVTASQYSKPTVIYDAWAVPNPSTISSKHTLSSRLMSKRQLKTPPVPNTPTNISYGSRPESRNSHGPSVSVILQQKKPRAKQMSTSHMNAYRAHAQNSSRTFHYQHQAKTSGSPTVRKLGDVNNFYVGGTAIR